jgi:hypothetical protein
MVFVMTFTNTTSWLSPIVTATMFSPVYETSNGVPENKKRVFIAGCDILPDGKLVFIDQEGKRLLMFSNNGNYEKDIVRFSGTHLPLRSKYTMRLDVGDCIIRMARRFMLKSVPQHS